MRTATESARRKQDHRVKRDHMAEDCRRVGPRKMRRSWRRKLSSTATWISQMPSCRGKEGSLRIISTAASYERHNACWLCLVAAVCVSPSLSRHLGVWGSRKGNYTNTTLLRQFADKMSVMLDMELVLFCLLQETYRRN